MFSRKQHRLASKPEYRKENLDRALDRSCRVIQLLANFYHQHGYGDRAQDLYRFVVRINNDRHKQRKVS